MMKSVPIIVALLAAGLAMQSSDAVAKQCKPTKVAATGFGDSKGIAKSLAWEAWELAVERKGHDKSFCDSDNVGSALRRVQSKQIPQILGQRRYRFVHGPPRLRMGV